jgi:hypothetical protein
MQSTESQILDKQFLVLVFAHFLAGLVRLAHFFSWSLLNYIVKHSWALLSSLSLKVNTQKSH